MQTRDSKEMKINGYHEYKYAFSCYTLAELNGHTGSGEEEVIMIMQRRRRKGLLLLQERKKGGDTHVIIAYRIVFPLRMSLATIILIACNLTHTHTQTRRQLHSNKRRKSSG